MSSDSRSYAHKAESKSPVPFAIFATINEKLLKIQIQARDKIQLQISSYDC